MKKLFYLLLSIVAFVFSVSAFAQTGRAVSKEDQKEIIALFKDVDPSAYRLQFNQGQEVYGKRQIQMSELEQIRKIRKPGGENGYIVFGTKDEGIMLIFAVTKGKVESLLGKEKIVKLNTILAKYQR
jgi:hypothetical protein